MQYKELSATVKYALLNEGGEFADTENAICQAIATWFDLLPLNYLNAFMGLFAQKQTWSSCDDKPASPTVSDPSPVLSIT